MNMGYLRIIAVVLSSILALSGVIGQPPLLQYSSPGGNDGNSQCEPLTLSLCRGRNLNYTHTVFPNIVGMLSQEDAEIASQSFQILVQLGCTNMADFLCILFAPPCLEVQGVAVPIPPCRHMCESSREQCSPVLQQINVTWPDQLECSKFPEIGDGPARCAEEEMRVLETVNDLTIGEESVEPPVCYEVTVDACYQIGFTHTTFPNVFGHTNPDDMQRDMSALTGLIVSGCSDDILPLICGAYLPKCDPETGNVIKPCKETCRRVSKECKDVVKEMSLGKLNLFSCRNYESKKTVGACVEDIRAPAPPVIMNITRTAVSQAQMFFQQPEIPHVGVSGLEITFYNVVGDDEGTVVVNTNDVVTIDLMTNSQYVILARAVNDWGKSPYVDVIIPEYKQGYDHCEPLAIDVCQGTYDFVQFPNLLQHENQEDAALEVTQFGPLIKVGCSTAMKPFLCFLYAPPCTGAPSPQGIKPPCQEVCSAAREGCEPIMMKFGFAWPDTLNCSKFPSAADVGRNCNNIDELTLHPAVNGRGKMETVLGSSATAYCSSGSADNRPEWVDLEGDHVPMKSSASGMDAFVEHLGEMTASLTIPSLSVDNSGVYTCQQGSGQYPMKISSPTTCEEHNSNVCSQLLPYPEAQYPNILGHVSATEADLASYRFLPLISIGCSPQNLALFVCSLYHPACGDSVLPPCSELCMMAMTECSPIILASQWVWPDDAQCSRFPSASDVGGGCVPAMVPPPTTTTESPTTTATPATTRPPGTTPGMQTTIKTTTGAVVDEVTDAMEGTPAELLRRSYSIRDRGMTQMFRGWVDVQGQGAPNDFCRVVRTDGRPFLSCLLAGSEEDDVLNYTSPEPSVEWFDPGYSNTWYMRDEDGDGRDDYCRCVGSVPSTLVVCMKAGQSGFEGPDQDFLPGNAPDQCFFYQADPYFGFE